MCYKCNRELITKAGLEKHMERCQGTEKTGSANKQKEACKNGQHCKYLKENRCSYLHEEHNTQPWKKVQSRRQGRKLQHHQEERQGPPRRQQVQQELPRRPQFRQQQQEACRNGTRCSYHKENRCNFFHPSSRSQFKESTQGRRKEAGRDITHKQQAGVSDQHIDGMSSRLRPCKFGNKCDKGVNCGFLHLPSDFLPNLGGRRN
jgi:hypothetical protein